MGRTVASSLLVALVSTTVASAQTPLTLADAMARARSQHPAARGAMAAEREASLRVVEARAGLLPRVDFVQEWQRGNQPVFVFSALLAQRRFDESRLAIPVLNHPEAVSALHSALAVSQTVFDGGLTRLGIRGASLGRDLAETVRGRTEQDLALAAARAYARVVELEAARAAAEAAVEAADTDLRRARARRDAGMVTEADVLAIDVHRARMRHRLVRTTGELEVSRAELNVAMGAPLDEVVAVSWPATVPDTPPAEIMERDALEHRPEGREARVSEALATNLHDRARAAYLPQVGVQGGYDFHGEDPGGMVSSWVVGVELRLNLFRGFADKARIDAAAEGRRRAAADRERVEQALRLDVRSAAARLEAARAGLDVGRAAVDQARESQRIIRDRYDSGLASMTDLVRAADAVLEAEHQAIASRVDVLLQSIALDRARGRL